MPQRLRIGSRPSQLALAQARAVRDELARRCPGLACEMVAISTTGDRIATPSLAQIGGKGLFVRELESALSDRRIDLAVHSMKDLPALLAPGFKLMAVPAREISADVLIAPAGGFRNLPRAARLGTSSARRCFEALRLRPDLDVRPLRGNIDTRIGKLRAGDFDAIILAAAGLRRLGATQDLPVSFLSEDDFVPAGGQGALAIEGLADERIGESAEIERALVEMDDLPARCEITAERAYLAAIGASCASPVGVKAAAGERSLTLRALLFSVDGRESMADTLAVAGAPHPEAAAQAGEELARRMLADGAGALIGHGAQG